MRLVLPTDTSADAPDLCGLWVTIHAVYRQWSLAREDAPEREDIADHLRRQLGELTAIPSDDWKTLLTLQGVTPLGLAAMSWTAQASLPELMRVWNAVYDQAEHAPTGAWEALRFVNPAVRPPPSFAAFVAEGFDTQREWRLLSLIFQDETVEAADASQVQPAIRTWFQTSEAA